jgi:hypothetical protein|tara:strand:+ start:1640 stop:2137 length:498 start_codon:yes stop_codon:yes gene_type:complete
MNKNKQLEDWIRKEVHSIKQHLIINGDAGEYELFGKFRIVPMDPGYMVLKDNIEIGKFSSTRSAVSWCILEKHNRSNIAEQMLIADSALGLLNNDIAVRSKIAEKSRKYRFREDVGTKLETKIIRRKRLEIQLAKYIDWAKYLQQRGFYNETARTGRTTSNKANR